MNRLYELQITSEWLGDTVHNHNQDIASHKIVIVYKITIDCNYSFFRIMNFNNRNFKKVDMIR